MQRIANIAVIVTAANLMLFVSIILSSWDKAYCGSTLAFDASPLKLAIYIPDTKVYDAPYGKQIGAIDRGRVIRVIESEEEWLHFTTWDYSSGWLKLESTCTIALWRQRPPYETVRKQIREWEKGVRSIDREIDKSLEKILELENRISAGQLTLASGLNRIEREQNAIEDSFRAMHRLTPPDVVSGAVEALERKRWEINRGLCFLIAYLESGENAIGDNARECFTNAEDMARHYSRIMFRIKSIFRLYDEDEQEGN